MALHNSKVDLFAIDSQNLMCYYKTVKIRLNKTIFFSQLNFILKERLGYEFIGNFRKQLRKLFAFAKSPTQGRRGWFYSGEFKKEPDVLSILDLTNGLN